MGEIKSTLDLVLERTKHLSQTSEEKQAQTQKDIENRLNGMLQKYIDGLFSLEQLQRDYKALKESLARKYNISGSAVVPNLESDEKWHLEAQAMTSAVEQKINQEKDRLVGS